VTKTKGHILVVDDEQNMRRVLTKVLLDEGHDVSCAATGEEALAKLSEDTFDVILSDVRMPGMDGMELMKRVKSLSSDTTVVMMTAYGSVQSAVEAIRSGAEDYILKPFNNDVVVFSVKKAIERKSLMERNRVLTEQLERRYALENIIGESPEMLRLFDMIKRVAPTSSTVLILGESGTGKELVARAIHNLSTRPKERIKTINCAACPRDLLESELFGHEKGAFTDARQTKRGLLEEADGGTVFLDEIGEMPPDLQPKLLRVIESGDFRRLGSLKEMHVDLRIVAATNRDLERDLGNVRQDLYFRLATITLRLPPLRERRSDIPLLIDVFIEKCNNKLNANVVGLEKDALKILYEAPWPGNVRELENAIERAVLLREEGEIQAIDLPPSLTAKHIPVARWDEVTLGPYRQSHDAFEREYFRQLLEENEYNVTRSAMVAGLSRRHVQDKIKKYSLRGKHSEGNEGEGD